MSNGLGKLGFFLIAIVGAVTAGAILDAVHSIAKFNTKVNDISDWLKLIDTLSRCPSINDLPLKRPIEWSKQINDGKNPCDSSYPEINLRNFSDNFVVTTNKTGIW